jgi:hypothetical protein
MGTSTENRLLANKCSRNTNAQRGNVVRKVIVGDNRAIREGCEQAELCYSWTITNLVDGFNLQDDTP